MRFCERHHGELVEDLVALDLSSLVDVGDLDLVERRVYDAHANGLTIDNFDPYGLAAWQFHVGVLAYFGAEAIELLMPADLGYVSCAVCFLDARCVSGCPNHRRLIRATARRQLERWRALTA